MKPDEPLDPQEELLWRTLARLGMVLNRAIEADLVHDAGISMTEYAVLMNLSEAPDHSLRMAQLASAMAMSASRITRVVDDLRARSYVTKVRDPGDARGNIASLAPAGLDRLFAAYPTHLASARRLVLDHLSTSEIDVMGAALNRIVNANGAPDSYPASSCE